MNNYHYTDCGEGAFYGTLFFVIILIGTVGANINANKPVFEYTEGHYQCLK